MERNHYGRKKTVAFDPISKFSNISLAFMLLKIKIKNKKKGQKGKKKRDEKREKEINIIMNTIEKI